MCRMLALPRENSFRFLGYWVGSFLKDTGLGEKFPALAEVGPVSHMMTRSFPLHRLMLDTFLKGVARGEVKKQVLKQLLLKQFMNQEWETC